MSVKDERRQCEKDIKYSKDHPADVMVMIVDAAANGAYSQPHFHRHTKVV